jgi:hypothetical protein
MEAHDVWNLRRHADQNPVVARNADGPLPVEDFDRRLRSSEAEPGGKSKAEMLVLGMTGKLR